MNDLPPDSRGYLRTEQVVGTGRRAGALAVLVGGAVLLGWALDVVALKSVLPGWVSMKPNTAVAFILTGVALLAFPTPDAQRPTLLSLLSRLCALFAGLIGLVSLSEYVFGWNPGFDQWLFCEPAGTVGTSHPGLMAPDSAVCFVLLAAGLEAARAMRHRNRMLGCTMVFGGLVAILALAAMLTYFTPFLGTFGWGGLTLMAVPTAIVFAVLGVALFLLVWPEIAAFCSLGGKITAAYVVGLGLVVFIGLTTSRSVLRLEETAHRVNHAERVSGAITDVLSEAAKAQAHTRGYVITGGERYFQSEQMAAARCRERMAALRQLISDPAQQARGVRLEAQTNELIRWFSQVIAARRTGNAGVVRSDMIDHGEDLMDRLRALIAQMDDTEMQSLQHYQQNSSYVSRFTHLIITSGTITGLIIFLFVLFGLNRAETKGQQALATLTASEVRYRRLFEAARDGILILDAETGMVVDVNPYLIELLGVTREVFLGKKVWELEFFMDVIANEANFAELQEKKYIRYEDMALEGHDGKRHEVEFVSNVYLVDGGKVIQCNIRDISERKQAEAELQASNLELERKNAELERFLYTASHDLKSPVVTVRTFLGFLEQDLAAADAGKIAKDMDFIRAATDKMGLLLDDVLDLARIGRVVAPPVRVTFRQLVDEALDAVAGRIAERGVTVTQGAGEMELFGDRLRLAEVVQNLVDNACKFMGGQPAPRIELGFEALGGETVFFVRDNGIGLDLRHQAKVFDLFEKLDPEAEGTGIGLALVKRIVEFHGGRIWVASKGAGQGACFYFTLPRAVEPTNQNQGGK